jgi:hypothetical protein
MVIADKTLRLPAKDKPKVPLYKDPEALVRGDTYDKRGIFTGNPMPDTGHAETTNDVYNPAYRVGPTDVAPQRDVGGGIMDRLGQAYRSLNMPEEDKNGGDGSFADRVRRALSYEQGGAIPDDSNPPEDMGEGTENTDSMDLIKKVLNFGYERNGLTGNTQTAAMPAVPAGPGGDQPNPNPFPTKTPSIPFGKRYQDGGEADNEDASVIVPVPGEENYAPNEDASAIAPIPDTANYATDQQTTPIGPDFARYMSESGANAPQNPYEAHTLSMPKYIMRYLSRADAADPRQVQQLEQKVDPSGTKDPNQRTVDAVTQAAKQGGLETGYAVAQSYAQRYEASRAFAAAALSGSQGKPGDITAAAQAANKAFTNLPNGMNATFTPSENGVTVTVTKGKKTSTYDLSAGQFNQLLRGTPGQFDHIMAMQVPQTLQLLTQTATKDSGGGTSADTAGVVSSPTGQPVTNVGIYNTQNNPTAKPQLGYINSQTEQQPDHSQDIVYGKGDWAVTKQDYDRLTALSTKLFPWVSQQPQREAWLAKQLDNYAKNTAAMQRAGHDWVMQKAQLDANTRIATTGMKTKSAEKITGQKIASWEKRAAARNVSQESIAKIKAAAASPIARDRNDASIVARFVGLNPPGDINSEVGKLAMRAAQRLNLKDFGVQAPTEVAPSSPQRPAPGTIRSFYGHQYKAGPNGWERIPD